MPFIFKRLLLAILSLTIGAAICFVFLEYGPGNRSQYDQVKNLEQGKTSLSTQRTKTQHKTLNWQSLTFHESAYQVLLRYMKISLPYWILTVFLTYLSSILLSYYFLERNVFFLPQALKTLLLLLYESPTFLVGIFLLYVANRYISPPYFRMEEPEELTVRSLSQIWAPLLTYLSFSIPWLALQIGKWMQDEQHKDYLIALKSRGFSSRQIFFNHLIPNLFPLILAALPLLVRNLFILSLAIEVTFQIHGFGFLSDMSFKTRDTPMLFTTFLVVLAFELFLSVFCDVTRTEILKSRNVQ